MTLPALSRRSGVRLGATVIVAASGLLASLPVASPAEARILKKNDWLIVAGKRFGPITAQTTERDLIRFFGRRVVKRKKSNITGDHQAETVTVIYPGTRNEIEVFWKKPFLRPSLVTIYAKGEKWRTPQGLKIGTSLAAVQRANGKPFSMSGFDWDYGSYGNWNKGRLPRSLLIRFAPSVQLPGKEAAKITGEVQLRSTDRLVRKAKPVISKISLQF